MSEDAHTLLLAAPPTATLLPDDPVIPALVERGVDGFLDVVAQHPASPLGWALLAEGALAPGTQPGDISAYAFARTGYHRGLDALRKAGWRGNGPIPWTHEANRGFLRALWALARAARRIGERDEYERCVQLLVDSDPDAYVELVRTRPLRLEAHFG